MENINLQMYESSDFATIFTIRDSEDEPIENISNYTFTITFYDKVGTELTSFTTPADEFDFTGDAGEVELLLDETDVAVLEDGFYIMKIDDTVVDIPALTGFVFILPITRSNIEYLLPFLRLKIGDITPASYRYADEWLIKSLILAMKTLQRYWNFKYLISEDNIISRNPNSNQFIFPEPPIIETGDEYLIVLMSAIITLEGSLENSAWDLSSWSDAEIRYTNLDSGKTRESNLQRMIDELNNIILPPTKRLARTKKSSLPGYKNNPWEHKTEY